MENLELRMYGLVPYNISPIQQAIQFGHGVVEYGLENFNTESYQEWAKNWKTFIILNGGTSNHSKIRYVSGSNTFGNIPEDYVGSMEKNLKELLSNDILAVEFYEPDLNDMLSAIVFLVSEKVFNKEKYPDYADWYVLNVDYDAYDNMYFRQYLRENLSDEISDPYKFAKWTEDRINGKLVSDSPLDTNNYNIWVEFVGGRRNKFLREFLKNFRLA